MEIIENRAVKMRLRNPDRVTAVIPKSKNLGEVEPGIHEVLVHFGLEESQILKNLKLKGVRSPIAFQYDWPGIYKPFAHQKTTAEFLTLHRRCYLLNEMGCVDADTEYLSPTGWRRIADYSGGAVAQYHPETGRVDYVESPEFVKLPCGDMIRIKTLRGVDQLLSPEHRVLYVASTGKRMVQQARGVYAAHSQAVRGWKGRFITTFAPDGGSGIPLTDAQLRVQVALMADGHLHGQKVTLRLKKRRKQERIIELLDAAGIAYTQTPCAPAGFIRVTFTPPLHSKTYGGWAWAATPSQLQIICGEVPHWDGSHGNAGAATFFTRDKASADFVQYAFAATGRTASVARYTREAGIDYVVRARGNAALLYATGWGAEGKTKTMWREPSTDGFKYCFMVPTSFLLLRRNGCIFATGNTGKTQSVLWAADYLMKTNRIKRVLVVCPVSIMRAAWVSDAFKCVMHRTIDVAHGRRDQRKAVIDGDAEIVVINYDGVDLVKDHLKGKFDLVVLDEATAVKTATTHRWKAINSIVGPDTWLWLMTGTPAPQSPLDAYGLAKLCTPSRVPTYFGAWRDKTMRKISMFKWVPAPRATEQVNEALQPAIRFTKEECLELPEMLYQTRDIEMSKQQVKFYNELRKKMTINAAGEQITAVHAASALNKLLQLSLGSAYTDTGEVVEFDASPRLEAMLEVVRESSHKTVVFAPFKHTIRLVTDTLDKAGITVDTIYGEVAVGKRTEIFKRFQETDDPQVLVIQPQSAAHGVTLTAASTIIWYGPTMSVETYLQGNARIHRTGQANKTLVVRLCGSEVERRLYAALDAKGLAHEKLLEMYESVVKGE